MISKTLESYGGQYADQHPVGNPGTEMAASYMNALLNDTAQLTRTGWRAIVSFAPTATAATYTYSASAVTCESMWGNTASFKPTVVKTGTGLYTVTFATSYSDELSEDETLAFVFAIPSIRGSTLAPPPVITSLSANACALTVINSSFAAADLTSNTVTIAFR